MVYGSSRDACEEITGREPPARQGSGDITDLVFNGVTVWRNKPKERGMAEARLRGDVGGEAELRGQPDGKALMWKQRETGEEPMALLSFDPVTKLFSI